MEDVSIAYKAELLGRFTRAGRDGAELAAALARMSASSAEFSNRQKSCQRLRAVFSARLESDEVVADSNGKVVEVDNAEV